MFNPAAFEERLRRDLAAFADARTEITVLQDTFWWTAKRVRRSLRISAPLGASQLPTILYDQEEYEYAQFFASDEMAGLRWLAEEIERTLGLVKATYPAGTIPAKVIIEDDGTSKEALPFQEAVERLQPRNQRTSLVFLKGRAGDGKSTSLIDLAHNRAREYAGGRGSSLYLYIDAQGRSLSRLDEAVALILDDLNATFRYSALSVLTRLGLIVPVVDGFDELLGSGGYAEAFSSLESFLVRLEGCGTVITSARSTFYQQSALSRAAARLSGVASEVNVEIHNVRLLQWDGEQVGILLSRLGVGDVLGVKRDPITLYNDARRSIGAGADEVLSSPLLTAAYATLLKSSSQVPSGSVVEAAIKSLVTREINEKLRVNDDSILDEQQFEALFSAIAEEMWWQETRTLDEETLMLVAELTLEGLGLEKRKSRALLSKLASNALIELGEGSRKLTFRHEIYFSYFLGAYFKRSILSGAKKEVVRLLSRALVSSSLARQCAWLVSSPAELESYLRALCVTYSEATLEDVINLNRGTLVAGALKNRRSLLPSLTVSRAVFSGSDLSQVTFDHLSFKECTFEHVDLCGATSASAPFEECTFTLPLVDGRTKVDFSGHRLGKEMNGIRLFNDGVEETLYRTAQNPTVMRQLNILDGDARPVRHLDEKQQKVFVTLERVIRFASRSMYFSENDFEIRGYPKEYLPEGAKHNLWVPADKNRRGTRQLYRLEKNPDEILAGAIGATDDTEILKFWEDVL